jgi:hypothetical protein
LSFDFGRRVSPFLGSNPLAKRRICENEEK